MAVYRLVSYPESPPKMSKKTSQIALWFGGSLLVALACFPLIYRAQAISDRFHIPGSLLAGAISLFCLGSFLVAFLTGLALRARPKYLREYGRQWWELTPDGMTHGYPGKPDRFVPVDALVGFSIQRGRTGVSVAEPFTGFLLSDSLADRDALWNALRGMGVPELPARSSWQGSLRVLPALALVLPCLIAVIYTKSLPLELLGGLGYLLLDARSQWTIAKRNLPFRHPLRQRSFYFSLMLSAFFIGIWFLPLHHNQGHRAKPPSPGPLTHSR